MQICWHIQNMSLNIQNYHILTKCWTIRLLCISVFGAEASRYIYPECANCCNFCANTWAYAKSGNGFVQHEYFLTNLKYANKLPKHMSCGYICTCLPWVQQLVNWVNVHCAVPDQFLSQIKLAASNGIKFLTITCCKVLDFVHQLSEHVMDSLSCRIWKKYTVNYHC